MADENKTIELEKKNAELQTQIASLELKLKEVDVAATQAGMNLAQLQITEKDGEIKSLMEKMASLADVQTKNDQLVKDLEAAKADATAKATELQTIQASILRSDRITTLVDKGVEKSEAETLTDKFIALSDEQFGILADMQATIAASKKDAKKAKEDEDSENVDQGNVDSKNGGATKSGEIDPAAAGADPAILDGAVAQTEPALNVSTAGKTAEIQSSLASYFAESFTSNKKSKKN